MKTALKTAASKASHSDLTIRPAALADIPAMVDLLRLLFSIEADFSFDAKRQGQGLAMLIESPASRACILVARIAGDIIGMATAQALISTAEGGNAAIVEDVVVNPKHRRQGVGRALTDAIANWALQQGIGRLQLLADQTNAPALKFYQAVGWRQTQLICLRTRTNCAKIQAG